MYVALYFEDLTLTFLENDKLNVLRGTDGSASAIIKHRTKRVGSSPELLFSVGNWNSSNAFELWEGEKY